MQDGACLAGHALAAHVDVAVDERRRGFLRQLWLALRPGVRDVVAQRVHRDRCLRRPAARCVCRHCKEQAVISSCGSVCAPWARC